MRVHDLIKDRRLFVSIACCAVLTFTLGCGSNGEEPAREVAIDQIEDAGGDPTQARPIAYFLIFPSPEKAERAASDLRARDFRVDADFSAQMGEAWLVVERIGVVSRDLGANEALLADVAAQYGGTYDGWEAATAP